MGSGPAFEIICEIQPPTQPDLMRVRHQIGVMSRMASGFLIPDNHIGRATISSVAVAHEVDQMGGRSIACLNARDRNRLGLRRDLLTAAAYRVDEFLLVYGDEPTVGQRSTELTVRSMMDEVRRASDDAVGAGGRPFRAGVTSRLAPLPAWKAEADFIFVQVCFDLDALLRWRERLDFSGRVYAGVMVPPSAARARKWSAELPQIKVPEDWITAIEAHPAQGVERACDLVGAIRDSGAFDGVHLVPGVRYREVAHTLENRR
ncbi:MAG TPA: methylenetetrahydrofolate reductase [Acidimicrobiales bacterium]|nr:methylenetetrahydrofolate reductase [Acidimicrobiales bacterium]